MKQSFPRIPSFSLATVVSLSPYSMRMLIEVMTLSGYFDRSNLHRVLTVRGYNDVAIYVVMLGSLPTIVSFYRLCPVRVAYPF